MTPSRITQAEPGHLSAVHKGYPVKPHHAAHLNRRVNNQRLAEKLQRENDRLRNTPHTLLLLASREGRYHSSAESLFSGLLLHYFECLLSGRLEKWKAAAHSCIDLMADVPEAKVHTRRTPSPASEALE